jgi:S-adenosylmethionine hydrolase
MKGAIFDINPDCQIVDITHEISPQDILGASFCLAAAYSFFPKGAIHVAVVDPGVGGERRPILVETKGHLFVGPDNGIFTFVYRDEKVVQVRELLNDNYFRRPVSKTFHGRDLFGPAAAHLSKGVPAEEMGPKIKDFIVLSTPDPVLDEEDIRGEVIHLDRFGNGITNIKESLVRSIFKNRTPNLWVGSRKIGPIQETYCAVAEGALLGLIGSSGYLEVAVRGGSASLSFGIKKGNSVSLRGAD